MILEHHSSANPWSPSGFENFADRYPATEWTAPPARLDRTTQFAAIWPSADASALPRDLGIVLTPGLFAEWLPSCFRAANRAFTADGHRVLQTRVRTSLGVQAQAHALTDPILAWLRPRERFVWCAHSKGALDALWSLAVSPMLKDRCAAAVVVQPPVGRSWLIDRWLRTPATLGERSMGLLLRGGAFREGVRDISSDRDVRVAQWVAQFSAAVPTLHAVSWSVQPTRWVDSYHRQLGALRPGHAHDGQFYLSDQRLPATPIVGLPALDHAQPVLGGFGFDAARLWRALVACVWKDVRSR
jgi:hypothetical protein